MDEQRAYRPAWKCTDLVLDGTSAINTGLLLWHIDNWKITATVIPAAGNSNQAVAFGCLDENSSSRHGMDFRVNGAYTKDMQFEMPATLGTKNYTGGEYNISVEKQGTTVTLTAPNGDVLTADVSIYTYDGPMTIGDGWKNGEFLGRKFKGTVSIEVLVYATGYLEDPQCLSLTSIMRRRQASYIDWSKYTIDRRNNAPFVEHLYKNGLCESKNGITQAECEAVSGMSQLFGNFETTNIPNLDDLRYFVNVKNRNNVNYPISYMPERVVTYPPGYNLSGGEFGAINKQQCEIARVTLINARINHTIVASYTYNGYLTNAVRFKLLRLFGNTTLLGYWNQNGNNSFIKNILDRVQIGGRIVEGDAGWWAFMDVGILVNNRAAFTDMQYTDTSLPVKDYVMELIDESSNVVSENDYYKMENGSIWSKDGSVLYWYDRTAAEVVIPQTCTKIAAGAIGQTPNITTIVIPEWVTDVFYGAAGGSRGNFINMPNLVEFRMDGGRTTDRNYDGAYLFYRGVPNLRVASMTKLSANSTYFNFSYLNGLRVLTIHSAVKNLNNNISGMTNLQKLHLTNSSVVTTWNTNLANITCDIYVPDALLESYKAATGWVDIADRIKPESEFNETYVE